MNDYFNGVQYVVRIGTWITITDMMCIVACIKLCLLSRRRLSALVINNLLKIFVGGNVYEITWFE